MNDQYTEEFLNGNPTRSEVNQYMNNLFMTINNSVGIYQGYMVSALVRTLNTHLSAHNINLDVDKFIQDYLETNMEMAKVANEKMREMEAAEREESGEPAPTEETTPPEISLL